MTTEEIRNVLDQVAAIDHHVSTAYKNKASQALSALFADELEKVREDAYMEGYLLSSEKGHLTDFLNRAVERNEDLDKELMKNKLIVRRLKAELENTKAASEGVGRILVLSLKEEDRLKAELQKKDAEIAQSREADRKRNEELEKQETYWRDVVDLSVTLWKQYNISCPLGRSITLAVLNDYQQLRQRLAELEAEKAEFAQIQKDELRLRLYSGPRTHDLEKPRCRCINWKPGYCCLKKDELEGFATHYDDAIRIAWELARSGEVSFLAAREKIAQDRKTKLEGRDKG